jgi:uncharacterized protein YndB with AHSA1/START domain
MSSSKSIELTITYDAPVSEVWKALTDPKAISEWLMPCNFEPKIGHTFQFKSKPHPGFDGIVDCKILELKENELLSYTWSGGSLKNTVVRYKLTDLGRQTKLDFEHSGFEGLVNKFVVRKILGSGWKKKILSTLLPQYLSK